jgi:WD40 repeat protein
LLCVVGCLFARAPRRPSPDAAWGGVGEGVSRIFLSHSSADNRQAVALKAWLVQHDPPLANEIFLDLDQRSGILPGVKWKDALRQASTRCEAVICLLSSNWAASVECRTEYRTAETLNKLIFCPRLEPSTADDLTSEWQRCDLFGDGAMLEIDVDDGTGKPVAFAAEGLHRLRQGIRGAGIGAESFVWPPPADRERAPYRGWEPLEEVDAAVFFGRDAQIVAGLDALRGMRAAAVQTMFVILAPSGAGKSSFLRAGLLPRLRRDDRNYLLLDILRPQRNVLTGDTGLARAIYQTRTRLELTTPNLGEIKQACLSGDVARVRAWLLDVQQAASSRLLSEAGESPLPTLVVPVDQGEELFSADAGTEAPRFLETIAALADRDQGGLGLILAVTIRTDRYQVLQKAPELTGVDSVVFDALKPMPRTQFIEVITGPARRARDGGHPLEIEPALVASLLDDCTEGADTLPLLALALARLYEDYGSDGVLTVSDYDSMGGLQHVVHTVIDGLLDADPVQRQEQLALLRKAFIPWLATVNPDNDEPMRRVGRWRDLPPESRPLLDALVAKRLLVKDDRDGEIVVEVALESLLRQWDDLAAWLAEEREDLKDADALEAAAAAWDKSHRNDAWLLPGTRLADAEILVGKPAFHDRLNSTREFLQASRKRENQRIEAERQQREAELQAAKDSQEAAEKLAATETAAKEEAQAHAVVLRKRSRILRIVLVITLLIAAAAVYGFVMATKATQQADARTREAVALRLTSQGQAMLAGGQGGGDVRALQQILAAPRIAPSADTGALFTGVVARRDTLKIIPTSASVLSAALSPDGHRIVSGSADDTLRLWDADTGQPIGGPLTGHTDMVASVAFSPDGHHIVSGSNDRTLRLWNADTGQPIGAPLTGHTGAVNGVAFSPDGHRIVSGSDDRTLRLWNADTGQPIGQPFTGHTEAVNGVAFSPDGHRIVSGSDDRTLRLWNADTGQPIGAPLTGHTDTVNGVAFSPDGHRIVSGSYDRTLRLWDADTSQPIGAPLTGSTDRVYGVAFSPDGHRIVSSSQDGTLRLWNADTSQPIGQPLKGHQGAVWSVAFSADGHSIISSSTDSTVRLWDADTGQPFTGHTGAVTSVAFSPDGHRIVSGSEDDTLRLWDPATGHPLGPPLQTVGVTSVAFSPDGHRIVSGSTDTTLRLWDPDTGQPVGAPLTGHTDAVTSVAFSPDGHRIVSGSEDHTLRLWNADTGQPIGAPLTGHTAEVWSVAFSPDGHRIVSGSADDTLRLWNADTRQPIGAPLTGHTNAVNSVAFSPDGHHIVSGSADDTLRLWNADTRQPVGAPLTGHTTEVWSVAFSPDGHRIVSGSNDHTLRLWSTDTRQPVGAPLNGHTDIVSSVAFSPDGQRIVSGSADDTLRLWPAPAQAAWPELLCGKLTTNMSHRRWNDWVSPNIDYIQVCPGLPIAPDTPS